MNLNDDYNKASRYRTIRKHLDSLGYRQALSLDALPLIEKLLADLIQTTDSLKHFKTLAQDNIEACSELQLSIDPYKCDNARLVQECNQLNLELIEAKETHQKQARDSKKKVYNLESECNNLQLASSRNLKRIKELEIESSQKSKKIQELLGKCCKPLISNASLASKKRSCYPLRRPSLESDPLPRIKGNSALPSLSKVEPSTFDLLAMADRKMKTLNQEVTALKGELSMQVDALHAVKTQLANKEKEISRLKKMLEGGRPYSAVSKDCSCKKADRSNERDEKTLDRHTVCHKAPEVNDLRMLQKNKFDLEQQLREALDKQHDAMSQAMKLAERNEELEKELRDIDHIALAVEADCNSAVKENNKRVSHLQEKLESVMTQVHVLEGELMVERRSGQELRADLEAGRLENRNLQRKLESTLEEKKKMTDRINELTIIEQNLNEEIQRLSRDNGDLRLEIARLDCANNLLKKQRPNNDVSQANNESAKKIKEKSEKNDKNRGKALTKKKIPASRGQRRSFSPPVNEKQTETTKRQCDFRDSEVTRDSNIEERNNGRKSNSEKDSKINQLQSTIEQFQTDRDYYKNEYNRLREQCAKNNQLDNAELWGQVCELRRQLIEKEHAVLDLQREKKDLCREKFELELRLQSSRPERRNVCHACSQCRPNGNCACPTSAGGDNKAMLERMERERDAARADVDRLVEERDSLRERLKLAVEAHKFEQHRLRRNLSEVETRLSHLERERQDVLLAQGTQRATIGGLEDQLEDLKDELRRTKQELATQRTQYFQLRTLQDQADQALGDVQGQLSQTEAELYKMMDRNRLLEQQRLQLDNEIKGMKQETNALRANVSRAEQEKDQIMMQLNERNERIRLLERELKVKEEEAATVEKEFQELQHKNQICVDQSAEQERRLRNMQMEMEINQRQLAAASNDRDNAAQENRRLQDDLAAVTCEIRTLQRELEVSRAESYDLKRQLQTYVSEVRRAEELINRKENERTEMLNHFRSLSLEATMLENNNHSLESEAAEARGALQSARDRALDLERQLTDRDCMIRGYETKITELTQTVASLETQIRQQIEQRQRAEADLNAVRDLCVKLDQQKETLVKELGDKDATKAQYEAQLSRFKAEQNMVQDQINRDHVTVERLETLLDQARQESMDSQAANQESQCEISRLKQKMCELQTKLSTDSSELRRYQNQAAEYSKQISELRRQVTNERFDRARKDEEHRRNCLCGESDKTPRSENFSRDTLQGNSQPRRLDCSSMNVQSGPPPRYAQNGKSEEYRLRGDLITEAQRTNRFDTSDSSNASPMKICKCTESNDIITVKGNGEAGRSSKNDETLSRERAAGRASSTTNYGGLCVRARLEEDGNHKNIRVRVYDPSICGCSNTEKSQSIVKLCTPLTCNDQNQQQSSRITDNNLERNKSKSPSIADDSTIREKEAYRLDRSSNIDQDPGKTTKARVQSDDLSDRELTASTITKKAISFLGNDTSGYDTSESPKCLCTNSESASKNESEKTNDTLNELKRLVEDGSRFASIGERSKSLPGSSQNHETQLDRVTSNISFPVCVDYSQAAITAADLTRPEFVQMLTELKEQTRNVEIELSRMNNAMRSARLNDETSDIVRCGRDRNKVRISYEPTDKRRATTSEVAAIESSNDFAHSTLIAGANETEKTGWRKKRKSKNTSSPNDILLDDQDLSDASELSKKFDDKPTTSHSEDLPDKNLRVSKNRIFIVETTDGPSIGTQTSLDRDPTSDAPVSTVNESVLVKPSRIHKLKKQSVIISGQSSAVGRKTCVDDPKMFPCAKERSFSSRPSRVTGSSPPETPAKSFIPTRQRNPDRARSSSTQSADNRVEISTSIADLYATAKTQIPLAEADEATEIQREPRSSRFSLTRLASRSPLRSEKNNKKSRSHSVDSNRNVSVNDSLIFHAINDGPNSSGKSNKSNTAKMIQIERTRTTPKPFTFKTTRKTSKTDNSTKIKSIPGQSGSSCTNDNCDRQASRLSPETRHNQTSEKSAARSSRSKKIDDPIGRLLERRTPGLEYLKDARTAEKGPDRSRSSSKSPAGPNGNSHDKLSLTNYKSGGNRLESVGTVECADIKIDSDSIKDNEKKWKLQQRSRSDPRESRTNAGRIAR